MFTSCGSKRKGMHMNPGFISTVSGHLTTDFTLTLPSEVGVRMTFDTVQKGAVEREHEPKLLAQGPKECCSNYT